MPAIQLPETSGKECSHGATDEVGSHENCIDTVRSAGIQFEDTRLVTELDALHSYINHDNAGDDSGVSVFSDEEQ